MLMYCIRNNIHILLGPIYWTTALELLPVKFEKLSFSLIKVKNEKLSDLGDIYVKSSVWDHWEMFKNLFWKIFKMDQVTAQKPCKYLPLFDSCFLNGFFQFLSEQWQWNTQKSVTAKQICQKGQNLQCFWAVTWFFTFLCEAQLFGFYRKHFWWSNKRFIGIFRLRGP